MTKIYSMYLSVLFGIIITALMVGTINIFEGHLNIVWDIRLPRILFAVLGGGVLSVSGAVFQILLNNRMADSFTLGMANGAVIGVAISILLGLSSIFVPVFGIFFGLASLFIVLFIAKQLDSLLKPETLVITGVLFSTLLSGVLYIVVMIEPSKTKSIVQFMFGSFAGSNYQPIGLVSILFLISFIFLMTKTQSLDYLALGELRAFSLGVNVTRLRLQLLIVIAIPALVLISYTGVIGFVGIIIPQMIQYIKPRKAKELFIISGLLGAIFLGAVDTLSRLIFLPIQLPTGVLLSIFSIPLILYLMYKRFLQSSY